MPAKNPLATRHWLLSKSPSCWTVFAALVVAVLFSASPYSASAAAISFAHASPGIDLDDEDLEETPSVWDTQIRDLRPKSLEITADAFSAGARFAFTAQMVSSFEHPAQASGPQLPSGFRSDGLGIAVRVPAGLLPLHSADLEHSGLQAYDLVFRDQVLEDGVIDFLHLGLPPKISTGAE
ncbi:MAG: hypothetical protein GY725_00455 [bacterium]|nr:hypothetical protein [bacterium]